jgi:periplasmic protein TonB
MSEEVRRLGETNPSSTAGSVANAAADDHLSHLLPDLGDNRSMPVRLWANLVGLINPPALPPLEVTSRPVDLKEALKNVSSEDLERSRLSLFVKNVKDLLAPQKLAPLEVTSRPVSAEEIYGQTLPEDKHRFLLGAIVTGILEFISPPKQPPLQLTSKPLPVKDIWTRSKYERWSKAASMTVHGVVIVLALVVAVKSPVGQALKQDVTVVDLTEPPPFLDMPQQKQQAGGGGGGGDNSLLAASKGRLPERSTRQFVPPSVEIKNDHPLLAMEPTIVVPDNVPLPQVNMDQFGDPFAKVGPPSNGTGSGGGIGSGRGGGVGSGDGAGVGPGKGGGYGGGTYKIGGGVSAPALIFKVEPEYSEEARKAKFQGTVRLAIVVDENGRVADVHVIRPAGLGLDEKAIEAVKKWRFRPAMRNSKAVAVAANVEVNFRLL